MRDKWIQDVEINDMNQLLAVKRRVRGLLHPNIVENHSIGKLLESAYIQGLQDGIEIEKNKIMQPNNPTGAK
jgi:hypothetical protein